MYACRTSHNGLSVQEYQTFWTRSEMSKVELVHQMFCTWLYFYSAIKILPEICDWLLLTMTCRCFGLRDIRSEVTDPKRLQTPVQYPETHHLLTAIWDSFYCTCTSTYWGYDQTTRPIWYCCSKVFIWQIHRYRSWSASWGKRLKLWNNSVLLWEIQWSGLMSWPQ